MVPRKVVLEPISDLRRGATLKSRPPVRLLRCALPCRKHQSRGKVRCKLRAASLDKTCAQIRAGQSWCFRTINLPIFSMFVG